MRPECIQQVEQAIGRALKKGEAQAIEDKISYHIRDMARTDPSSFNSMTEQQRQLAAAQAAMADHMDAVEKQAQRKALNLLAQTRELANQKDRAAVLGGKQSYHSALFERLRQIDTRMKGERNRAFSSILDVIEAASPRFLGIIANRAAERDFVREVYGQASGNANISKAAKAWGEQMDALLERMNAAGAMIGKLDYGWLPQPHDMRRVLRAGVGEWSSYVLPRLDRRRYLNEDGTQMDDAAVMDFLAAAHETLRTNGLNKVTPGAAGQGSRASRSDNAHRQIHFKDADSYLDYMSAYGPANVFEAMRNSVNGMIKDITLIEQLGPNSAQTYRLLRDTAQKLDAEGADRAFHGTELFATPDMVWDTLNGSLSSPVNSRFADINQGIRNFMVAAKLQATFLTSILGDQHSLAITAAYNHVSYGQSLINSFKSLSPSYRKDAALLSLQLDSVAGDLVAFHTNNLAQGWTGKLASATMKATMLEGMTNAIRRGFSIQIMNRLASDTRKTWGEDSQLKSRLERNGINEQDWAIWQAATPETWRGQQMLTPESLTRLSGYTPREINDAVGKMLGYIQEESEFTSLQPGLMTRATIRQGTQAGSVGGEALRHATLFKSFGVAMIERHWKRIAQLETAQGRLAYSAAFATGAILTGALTNQLMDIWNGRDPRDIKSGEFWLKAAVRGGGAAILGDIFYTGLGGDNAGGQPNLTGLLGPVAGTAADIGMTLGSAFKKSTEPSDVGANLLRIGYQNTPFIRSWYTKSIIEHALIHDLQENLSPGYLRRMERKAQKDFGQQFWWRPGASDPSRAPDLSAAFK